MHDWNVDSTWFEQYGMTGGFENKIGFGESLSYLDGRKFAFQLADDDAGGLSSWRFRLQKLGAAGFSPAAETLIVGCGFGWFVELLVDVGSNAVWGAEISPPILSRLNLPGVDVRQDVQPLILNVDFTAPDAVDQFKALGAGNNKGQFRNVVTEHVLDDWLIGDIQNALDACDALRAPGQSQVFHLVTTADELTPFQMSDVEYNWLTLAEWVALRPEHFWIDQVTGQIGGGQ